MCLIGHMAWGVNSWDMIIILTFDLNMTWSVPLSGHMIWSVVTWHGYMISGHMTWLLVTWHDQWSHDMINGHMTLLIFSSSLDSGFVIF